MPPRAELDSGWQAACTAPDACATPAALGERSWWPARVPGTAASVLRDLGRWAPGEPPPALDEEDWWFRVRLDADAPAPGERVVLGFDGVATHWEAYLDGERIAAGASMFARTEVDVGDWLGGAGELVLCCRALGPRLRVRRKPRARWRTRVADGSLRFERTSLLGRAPGFAPGPAPVGPWRPVWLERRRDPALRDLRLRPRLEGGDGVVAIRATVDGPAREAVVRLGGRSAVLAPAQDGSLATELRVPAVARWWPHTHGEPVLHELRLELDGVEAAVRRIGFRTLERGDEDGLDLRVNGVRVFARGAVWTPVDAVGLAPDPAALRAAVEQARGAGLNMLRVPGLGAYESPAFHDLCDELGVLVWQDLMLANFDYPLADPGFRAALDDELAQLGADLGGRPSLAVVCGSSEVEQQAAMIGVSGGAELAEHLGRRVAALGLDAAWVPSAPSGGALPFRPGAGVANYYGVGGYRRELGDARRAGVRFAAECLAFANVGEEGGPPQGPDWKRGVPRDHGSSWDFEDVRDHYLALLHDVDPAQLRAVDPERYLERSRAVTGELMAAVLGEWRRAASPCGGALVLWLRDLLPGSGWGIVDHAGVPKAAFHHVRRACAPLAVWLVDEGLGGLALHVANDGPRVERVRLRVALYRDLEHVRDEVEEALELDPHGAAERDVEGMLGRFVDASWAYRFGPPGHDAVVATLERDGRVLSQAFAFPAGRPRVSETPERLGLRAQLARDGDATVLAVSTRRLAYGVRVHAPGLAADDDAFSVEPGGRREIMLRGAADAVDVRLSALNLDGRLRAGWDS